MDVRVPDAIRSTEAYLAHAKGKYDKGRRTTGARTGRSRRLDRVERRPRKKPECSILRLGRRLAARGSTPPLLRPLTRSIVGKYGVLERVDEPSVSSHGPTQAIEMPAHVDHSGRAAEIPREIRKGQFLPRGSEPARWLFVRRSRHGLPPAASSCLRPKLARSGERRMVDLTGIEPVTS